MIAHDSAIRSPAHTICTRPYAFQPAITSGIADSDVETQPLAADGRDLLLRGGQVVGRP